MDAADLPVFDLILCDLKDVDECLFHARVDHRVPVITPATGAIYPGKGGGDQGGGRKQGEKGGDRGGRGRGRRQGKREEIGGREETGE